MPIAQLPTVGLNYLQVDETGASETHCGDMVMIHGLAANLAFWRFGAAPAMAAVCRITLYDLRGHGHSEMAASGYTPEALADDLRDLLDHLGLQRVHILAHSFGGMVAVLFALRFPERVRSLILADVRLKSIQPRQALKDWGHWPRWRERLERAGIQLDEEHDEGGYELLLALVRWQARQKKGVKPSDQFLSKVTGITGGRRAAGRWLKLQETSTFRKDFFSTPRMPKKALRSLEVPILALYGEYSQALPTARALRRLCPNCKMKIIPGVGHFFPLTHGRKLVRPTRRFLNALVERGL